MRGNLKVEGNSLEINNTSNSSFISEQGDIEDCRGGKVKKENVKVLKKAIKETSNIIKRTPTRRQGVE